jgi:hypothetical protein
MPTPHYAPNVARHIWCVKDARGTCAGGAGQLASLPRPPLLDSTLAMYFATVVRPTLIPSLSSSP